MVGSSNPFEITKAVDFTDAEIAATFVDLPIAGGGFARVADPRSPMPHFLVGGKGGGRTHLMRHLSYRVQSIGVSDRFATLRDQGYVGVYVRCSGLNSNRFRGKRHDAETWDAVFAYYMDLWICEAVLDVLADIGEGSDCPWDASVTEQVCDGFVSLLDDYSGLERVDSIAGLRDLTAGLLREIDRAVNNAAFGDGFHFVIRSRPGKLIFGLTDLIAAERLGLDGLRVTFLLDEFENLDTPQQRYVQTLVREKVPSAGFIIGSRRYGLRTFETLGAREGNKQGSEYELTVLEDVYAANRKAFKQFCYDVALSRVRRVERNASGDTLRRIFGDAPDGGSNKLAGLEDVVRMPSEDRPHMRRLFSLVEKHSSDPATAGDVVAALSSGEDPLEEKLRLLRFYQLWSRGSEPTADLAIRARSSVSSSGKHAQRFAKHHRGDMLAQLYHENSQGQAYLGFDEFVSMSGYLPRNLLVVLKNVVRWADFLGEDPLNGGRSVSRRAQSEGVLQASGWFLRDALPEGELSSAAEMAVRRLGGFLRRMRMSDKPVEVDCVSFSTDLGQVGDEAKIALRTCVEHSLLIEISRGQIDRNSRSVHHKYQLNPMLAPLFELPTSRRGTAKFSAAEVNAIFTASSSDAVFDQITSSRMKALTAPFSAKGEADQQGELF